MRLAGGREGLDRPLGPSTLLLMCACNEAALSAVCVQRRYQRPAVRSGATPYAQRVLQVPPLWKGSASPVARRERGGRCRDGEERPEGVGGGIIIKGCGFGFGAWKT